jgi:error-prone DNA polymerase
VRPVSVLASAWDCTLEGPEAGKGEPPAIRMGLRFVKGLGTADGERIDRARRSGPFRDPEECARRTGLGVRAMRALAEAGAFEGIAGGRRAALWSAAALGARRPDLPLEVAEAEPGFAPLGPGEEIRWDHLASGHSARGHPLESMRAALRARRLLDAREVAALPDGASARTAGIVICRQRPGTASGVVFLSLEDETGFVNVVLWARVFEEFSVLARTRSFLGVGGRVQSVDGVVHLVARSLFDPRADVGAPPETASRDFR